jgi:hypothetical protein
MVTRDDDPLEGVGATPLEALRALYKDVMYSEDHRYDEENWYVAQCILLATNLVSCSLGMRVEAAGVFYRVAFACDANPAGTAKYIVPRLINMVLTNPADA